MVNLLKNLITGQQSFQRSLAMVNGKNILNENLKAKADSNYQGGAS